MALHKGVNCTLLLQNLLPSRKSRCIIRKARNTGHRDTNGGCAVCVCSLGRSISILGVRYSNSQLLLTTLGICTHCVYLALDSEPRGCQWQLAMFAFNDILKGHVEMIVVTSIRRRTRRVLQVSASQHSRSFVPVMATMFKSS